MKNQNKKLKRILIPGICLLLALILFLLSFPNKRIDTKDGWECAYDAAKNMKIGWNLGNTLDSVTFESVPVNSSPEVSETAWGNPITTREMIKAVKEAGFETVRVPVTWGWHMDENNVIDEAWLDRVEEIVNYVLDEDMYCIIDVHHDTRGAFGWLRASYDDWEYRSTRFKAIWEQVSERFKNYGEKLLFEGYNEILDEDRSWVRAKKEPCDAANELNQIFVDTVRTSGGNNERRNLIITPYCAGVGPENLMRVKIPEDLTKGHIILDVHSYIPGDFTNYVDKNKDDTHNKMTLGDKMILASTHYYLGVASTLKGVPFILGEFGNVWKHNSKESAEYVSTIVRFSKMHGMTCIYWDDGAEYSIFDRENLTWKREGVVEAMMEAVK